MVEHTDVDTAVGPSRRARRQGAGRYRGVGRLVLHRLAWSIPVVLVVTALIFFLASVSPFDPVSAYLGAAQEHVDGATRARAGQLLGVEDPWWRHYLTWLAGVARGDLGLSVSHRQPVADVLGTRLPWTILLAGLGLVVAAVVAVLTATVAAVRPEGVVDRLVVGLGNLIAATPPYLVSMGLIAIFAVTLRWLPGGGLVDPGEPLGFAQVASHLVLPTIAMAVAQQPWLVLHLRESLVTAYASDPVTGARLRGVSEPAILFRHVLPVSLLPLITVIGARVPEIITGAVLIEAVSGWPGLGQSLIVAATSIDYPLLAALTALAAFAVLAGNLAADVGYRLLDPRTDGDRS